MNQDDSAASPARDTARPHGHQPRVLVSGTHACGVTDVGRVRARNEDALYVAEDGSLFVLADGMGGHAAGDVASGLAVDVVVASLTGAAAVDLRSDDQIPRALEAAVDTAQRVVVRDAQRHVDRRGMGTVLVAAHVRGDTLHTCHVGDVRCYVDTGRRLEQITSDHSEVGALVRAGRLSAEEARTHPRRHYVVQAIGLPEGITPELNSRSLGPGALVLLCSDGLWEAMADAVICEIIRSLGTLQERAEALVDETNARGGHDNTTVILYEHVPRPTPLRG